MREEINLLAVTEKPGKKSGYQLLARQLTIALMVFYILATSGVFSFYFFLSRKERQLTTEIEAKEKRISELAKIESLQLAVGKRLSALVKIFDKEKGKIGIPVSLGRLEQSTAEKASLESFQVGNFGNSVILSGSAANINDLIQFFERLTEPDGAENGFDSILVSDLRKTDRGYDFKLNLEAIE
jgi:hypothetical protein